MATIDPGEMGIRSRIRDSAWYNLLRNFKGGVRAMLRDRTTAFYFFILVGIFLLGVFGPVFAPYDIEQSHYSDDGELLRTSPPSVDHPLGTTSSGYDVLSRLMVGARPTVLTGVIGGLLIVTIGTTIGLTAGYVGGRTEEFLMRLTDFAYGVPLIPFGILLIALFELGFLTSILIIGLLLWRSTARAVRAQTLKVKEYPFVQVAKASGASTPRIILKHVLPNVAPVAVFLLASGIGYTIIIKAGLTFVGVANPFVPSWGVMIRSAFNSGQMGTAWWWSIPPGVLIGITVLSTFMFGRGYEAIAEGTSEQSDAEALNV